MMKLRRYSIFLLLLLVLTACRSSQFGVKSAIEWVDFVKWDGIEYNGIYSGVIADQSFIGKKIGEIKFMVANHVSNPNYKIKNGDAAFHEKGTEIFEITDYPNLIALKDQDAINGYRVYFARESGEFRWHFKDMPVDMTDRIEIYQAYTPSGTEKLVEWSQLKDVRSILEILMESTDSPNFQPNTTNGDPIYYEMVFYTDEPVAYKFSLHYDRTTYFWHPMDTAILDNEIGNFIH